MPSAMHKREKVLHAGLKERKPRRRRKLLNIVSGHEGKETQILLPIVGDVADLDVATLSDMPCISASQNFARSLPCKGSQR